VEQKKILPLRGAFSRVAGSIKRFFGSHGKRELLSAGAIFGSMEQKNFVVKESLYPCSGFD